MVIDNTRFPKKIFTKKLVTRYTKENISYNSSHGQGDNGQVMYGGLMDVERNNDIWCLERDQGDCKNDGRTRSKNY